MEALALQQRSASQLAPASRAALAEHLQAFTRRTTGAAAAACAADPRCYNNLKLVDAVAMLELAPAGIRSARSTGSVQRTQRILKPCHPTRAASRVAPACRCDRRRRRSDPVRSGAQPARLPRALVRDGDARDPPARRRPRTDATGRAPCALGADRPGGPSRRRDVDGTRHPAGLDVRRERLRRAGRRRGVRRRRPCARGAAESTTPSSRSPNSARVSAPPGSHSAQDRGARWRASTHSADTIVYNGLALTFLQLAIGEADAAAGSTAPLPAEVPGARMLDPNAAGVAAIRSGRVWLAVHRAATHPARRALRRRPRRGDDPRSRSLAAAPGAAPEHARRAEVPVIRPFARHRRPHARPVRRARRERRRDHADRRLARRWAHRAGALALRRDP